MLLSPTTRPRLQTGLDFSQLKGLLGGTGGSTRLETGESGVLAETVGHGEDRTARLC
jgi:hypothetical protein